MAGFIIVRALLLSSLNIFVQSATNGTIASKQFLNHSLDLLAQTSLVQVETKHVLAAVESLQAAPILIGLTNLQWSNARR